MKAGNTKILQTLACPSLGCKEYWNVLMPAILGLEESSKQ
jgi:hypothetical protein